MSTFLLFLGLIAAVFTVRLSYDGYDAAARNWSYAQMVILWMYFLLK